MQSRIKRGAVAILAAVCQLASACALCLMMTPAVVSAHDSDSCHAKTAGFASLSAAPTCCEEAAAARPAIKSAEFAHQGLASTFHSTSAQIPTQQAGPMVSQERLDTAGPPLQSLLSVFRV